MTDLTEAAERLLRNVFDDDGYIGDRLISERAQEALDAALSDGRKLAKAVLPWFDQTEITEDWLRSVGFERFGEALMCSLSLQGLSAQWIHDEGLLSADWTFKNRSEEFCGGVCDLPDQSTRGEVRQLCAALGIELQEPANEDR